MLALSTIVFHWLCLFLITHAGDYNSGVLSAHFCTMTNYSFFPHWESYNGMASYITQLFLWLEVFHPQKYIILDENVSVLLWILWEIGCQFKQTVHQNLHR